MSSPNDSLLGKQIDGYRIEKLIAHGGMGAVYRAQDVALKRPVALKVIHALNRQDAEFIRRFEREAQFVAQLAHPNIVPVYRFGEVDGLYYIAMQYIEGADLGWQLKVNRIAGEVMPFAQVLSIMQDIAGALDYAHTRGIIHRDVKPANILLDTEKRAYLSDFGIARLPGAETHSGFLGSPYYMSPEQITEGGRIVPQTDLYSLGITLFEMLTGHLPFIGDGTLQVAIQHVSQTPPPPSRYNPALTPDIDQVVLRLMAKDPADRFQTARDMLEALQQSFGARQDDAYTRPISHPQRARSFPAPVHTGTETLEGLETPSAAVHAVPVQPARRRPLTLILVSAALVVLALGLLAYRSAQDAPTDAQAALVSTATAPPPSGEKLPLDVALSETTPAAAPPTETSSPSPTEPENTAIPPTQTMSSTPVPPTNTPTMLPPTETPVPTLTESAVTVTAAEVASVPTVAQYALLVASSGTGSLYVVNLSVVPFPLTGLRLGDGETSLSGGEWGVAPLANGECVSVWLPEGGQPPDVTCGAVGARLTRSAESAIWSRPLTVYYNDRLVMTCGDAVCVVRITA